VSQRAVSSSPSRAWRGAVLGLVGWYIVVVAHVAAAGSLPSVGAVVTSGGLAALIGVGLAGRSWTWLRAFAALLLLQPTLHLALAAMTAGHHQHPPVTSAPGVTMVLAHVAAAAITAALLSHGERAVGQLATLLATTWRRLSAAPLVCTARAHPLFVTALTRPMCAAEMRWSLIRRGPPTSSRVR
jgi:hypothetical protein